MSKDKPAPAKKEQPNQPAQRPNGPARDDKKSHGNCGC